jgi:hypothetical protein
MISTMRELKQLIEDNCDLSQPLRVVSRDVGKKAAKHSIVRADENHLTRIAITPGMYDDRGVIELTYDPDTKVLMPEDALTALDNLLEDVPKALIGWVYFFYYPMDYVGFLGRVKRIECSMLDTSDVRDIYMADDEPNTLIIEADYGVGSFD